MSKNNKIKAYFLRVDEHTGKIYRGYFGEIENTLEAKQAYVNYNHPHGLIQVVTLGEIDVICEDEGKLKLFPTNRAIVSDDGKVYDYFAGNVLCVRHNAEGEFTDILESDKEYIEEHLPPIILLGEFMLKVPDDELSEYKEG